MPCWEGKVSACDGQLKPPAPFPASFLWLGGDLGQEKEQVLNRKGLAGASVTGWLLYVSILVSSQLMELPASHFLLVVS